MPVQGLKLLWRRWQLLPLTVAVLQVPTDVRCSSANDVPALPTPIITWGSYPISPGQVAMLSGSNFPTGGLPVSIHIAGVHTGGSATATVIRNQSSSHSCKFVLPTSLDQDVFAVTISGSAPYFLNAPEVWSIHGDLGNTSTPGGTVRLIGRGLATAQGIADGSNTSDLMSLTAQLAQLTRDGASRAEIVQLTAALQRKLERPGRGGGLTQLRLIPERGGSPVLLTAQWTAEEFAQRADFSATFQIPPSIALGAYKLSVSVSNEQSEATGPKFFNISTFVSPAVPRCTTLEIRAPLAFKPQRFLVARPPHGHRVPTCAGDYGSGPGSPNRAFDSLPAVQAAFAKARANGGGEVHFPRGQYWLSGAVVVPPGVRLTGEGTQLVSLYFKEASLLEAPKPAYFFSAWESPPPPPPQIPYAGSNATGVIKTDPDLGECGEHGCCITRTSSFYNVEPCDADQNQQAMTMIADKVGLVQLRFSNCTGSSCCLSNTHGHFNPTCSSATGWKVQRGYFGNQTVLQTADARGCLTVGAKHGAKITPGLGLQIDQCWHINKTQNFLVPGLFFPPPAPPPPPVPPHPAPSTTAWGVENLTIYITHWYNGVFHASTQLDHEFFHVRHVRVRANPWFAENPVAQVGGEPGKTRGRSVDYAIHQMQVPTACMVTANTMNFAVTDSDLYGAGGAIIYSSKGGPARFGDVSRNRIWNGMTSHWFDNARDIIFESNHMTGVSLTAYGSNMDTYGGGFAQHILISNNTYEMVWGNDREITTYDNAGGCYLGPVAAYTAGSRNITSTGGASASECSGGAIIVLNGTGRGQIRRVVAQTTASNGNARFEMDEPLSASVDPGRSWIQVMPFRGRNLFVANTYRDVGAVQFYGIGLEQIVSKNIGERMGGFLSWGQWRGYDHNNVTIPQPSSGGGGAGFNPNIYSQFLENDIAEGNTIVDYNGEYDDTSGGFGCNVNGSAFLVTDDTHWAPDGTGEHFHGLPVPKLGFPLNSQIVFRGNRMQSNSGIRIERQAEDVLIEGTLNNQTDTVEPIITPDCARVLVKSDDDDQLPAVKN